MPYQWLPPTGPETHLHLSPHRSLPRTGFVWFIGITVGALGLPGGAIAAIVPLWLMTVYGIARTTYKSTARKREQTLLRLADRLVVVTAELVGKRR